MNLPEGTAEHDSVSSDKLNSCLEILFLLFLQWAKFLDLLCINLSQRVFTDISKFVQLEGDVGQGRQSRDRVNVVADV